MAYLGDIRENGIGPNGEIWENDNRIEERHYWNGAFIDLCGLSAEDYAKTIFVTSGSNSGAETPTKQKNPITVEEIEYTNENGEVVYAYKAFAKQPVTSEVTIEMVISDEFGAQETITIVIPVGESASELAPTRIPMMMGRPKVNNSNYNPKEDEEFMYNIILPEEPVILPMAYSITLKKGEVDSLSDEDLIEKLLASGTIDMKDSNTSDKFLVDFSINSVPVDGFSDMSVPEMDEALISNSQDIIIVTDKTIKSIEQSILAGINELDTWTKREGNIVIDGKTYTVWYKREENDTNQSSVYDPVTKEMTSADSREYIIYYE